MGGTATMAGDQTLLQVEGLSIALPRGAERAHAVEDISFTLNRNEILCVVGESGSGKSMTANAIMGLLPLPHVRPVAGRIVFEGEDLLTKSEAELRRLRGSRVGMIFQEPMTALNPLMTIGRQIGEVFDAHGRIDRRERRRLIMKLLADVGLPDPEVLIDTHPFRLSGGQRQRVMIAMALALEPAMLIADEPTTALDVTTQAQILDLIRSLQASRHMGVMFITHDFGVVAEIADRVAVMQTGKIVELGPAGQVLNDPQHPYTRRLIGAVPQFAPPERPAPAGEILLNVEGLKKTYTTSRGLFVKKREVAAARDITFEIRRGETLGLVGESGSGKSTVGRCLVRLLDTDGGHIRFRDLDFASLRGEALRAQRRHIQMVFQDPYASLNPRQKVGRIIAQGPRAIGVPEAQATARARELLELVGLGAAAAERYPHEFSGGQRQRIGIARALALDPELLVADEPVSALDVSVQAQVLDLLDDIKQRLNLAMLFITHDLRVAAQICDRMAVMRLGEIVEYGPTHRVFNDPQHPYTRDLLAAVPGRDWTIPEVALQDGSPPA
ncbi:peptide/nickel transport system ATP-binding protein [Tistlia consotensis]|uniref:Peptide/nickel transport system ATP-binding protein n=1 Tax=Tistlia consotensis USBA 355 TaxID=560819 RepID=A0A1Y6CV42_9PROT|nr:ABC transporter ATP-binding protein [Tistlia consotensis]SMF77117.1 peptide/nickel transport system ATP-binding protein [Tistlia consotensis USBA 355]SNS14207.1 peptide/nickel transport system ATP-binding protein [Tistlia consotensis]